MPRATTCIIAILTASLFSGSLVLAQQTPTSEPVQESVSSPAINLHNDWPRASLVAKRKLFVVTLAEPTHRHACHVQSITADQLVCKGSFGTTHTYKPQEIVALIRPGDNDLRLPLFLGFNSALGAAIWGTVVLVPVCIPCAVGTGIAAYFFFAAAGATAYADGQPDTLLYLAPGQTLQVKLH